MENICQIVDIETWSTAPTASIASIGACRLNFETGDIYDDFYINVSKKSCDDIGLNVQQETVDWWKKQDRAVLKALMTDTVPISTALDKFFEWHKENEELWCHGLNFDAPIIQNAAMQVGYESMPWKYYNLRCSRTLLATFGVDPMAYREKGVHHNALGDARAQAKMIYHVKKPLLDAMNNRK